MPSLFPPNLGFGQNPSPVPQHAQDGATRPFDYNTDTYNANTRLPGLGVPSAAGPLVPPPPFTFMPPFPSTQFPHPPFPPLQMPPLRYPSIPVPPVHGYEPVRHATSDYHMNNSIPTPPGPQPAAAANSESDPDREEGELTDREESSSTQPRPHNLNPGQGSGQSYDTQMARAMDGNNDFMESDRTVKPNGTGSLDSHNSHLLAMATVGSAPGYSEMDRGGASPETRLSSRSSGSPYNPAPPISTEPPVSDTAPEPEVPTSSIPQYEADPDKGVSSAASTDPQSIPGSGRSLAQLRVQAQGALLSLAPHNIRYAEFVGEGINPVILRQLYEEVGIKIATPVQGVSTPPSSATSLESDRSSTSQSGEPEQGSHSVLKSDADQSSASQSKSTELPPDTTKPMERKEVIARMLAAKAAKGSGAPGQVQVQATKESSASEDSVLPNADKNAAISSQDSIKEKETRVKEKNKAQTELARQRIELLKKQGLMRNGQKSQSNSVPPEKSQPLINSGTESLSTSTPMPIQHPLPERPPDPEPNASARIPGLFMTEQEPENVQTPVSAAQGATDAVSQTRINQRKRPRASDFDEPVPIPKKTFNNGVSYAYPEAQRLVIDISDDDEFYGDDEHDNMDVDLPAGKDMQDVEGLLRTYTPTVDILPQRPATASSQGFSASATPQSLRNNDQEHQEHLRRKDLEIKAMHKRIAELEERKKAKLAASRTQSPRPSDVPEPSPPTDKLSPTDVSDTPKLPVEVEVENKSPANIDLTQVESIKVKLLRKQEIEVGIPALDAEIHKSEAKLAEINEEEARLVSEITKGREGRRQLLDELNNLNVELNGLTFDDVEAAIRCAQEKEDKENKEAKEDMPQLEAADQQQCSEIEHAISEPTHAASPVNKEPEDEEPSHQSVVSEEVHEPDSGNGSSVVPDDKVMDDVSESSGEVSSSDSTGSAMDESSDSSSDESLDEEELPTHTPAPETNTPLESGGPAEDGQPEPIEAEAGIHHDLPERPRTLDAEPRAELHSEQVADEQVIEDQGQASRESSVSDAYEPPEPEETASPADSSYSPPFSPASPEPVDSLEVSTADETRQADEPLTRKVQEWDTQQPSAYAQVGILDNPRVPEQSEPKFSPYVSPLKNFKAYRYHPNFTENVSGGYRSLTYSHNIDPMRYLCPFESSGGVCNDRSCEFQHFRDMTLSDDKILVQMGSLREGKTPEEKDEYIAGLKQIINDMRRDKVKDFNTVATEIAAYRRRFLQDPSRVLPL
ncbi:hypothetical protein BO85DRAFT_359557 [Aspergillus piperis CBS 112811]|uniref:Putative zinc-finger domain-containing protein n=1 Tax=Aspergillus piperis CBS 112811 TaxID=1448313 RepID=A0A8G1RBL4_9EURO|nr:hypothetical protein BO85DRAFT_359557 [Aspergillus piperis CBS 112811]RAH62868.1 hypothetical protein BO85DRAFT_359557 [Aspergillus piperis CBS 112811]